MSVVYPNIVDIGCYSHTIDHVEENFQTPYLDWESIGWNIFRGVARISVTGVPRLAACAHARTGVGGIACLLHSQTVFTVYSYQRKGGCSSPLSHPLATPLIFSYRALKLGQKRLGGPLPHTVRSGDGPGGSI